MRPAKNGISAPILVQTSMSSQAHSVQLLLKSFPQRPFDQKVLHALVVKEVQKFQGKSFTDNVKSQWEFLLKNEVFTLAVRACVLHSDHL